MAYGYVCLHSVTSDWDRSIGEEASLDRDMGISNTRSLQDMMRKLRSGQCCKGHSINWILLSECPPLCHILCCVPPIPCLQLQMNQPSLYISVEPRCFQGAEYPRELKTRLLNTAHITGRDTCQTGQVGNREPVV